LEDNQVGLRDTDTFTDEEIQIPHWKIIKWVWIIQRGGTISHSNSSLEDNQVRNRDDGRRRSPHSNSSLEDNQGISGIPTENKQPSFKFLIGR